AVRSGTMAKMTVNNFAGIDLDMNGNQSGTINAASVMYGSIVTGAGNDTINVAGSSNSATNNLLTISAGNGANTISYTGGANNRAAIIAGTGADTISFAGQASGAINAGAGNDRIDIRSTGNVSITGGGGADVFSFIAGAHATIADFKAGEDRIEFSGVSSTGIQVRNNGISTVIDINGQNAVVLAGVALTASQINLSYV
ncbi:MAG TPA: hypothetical protein VFS04_04165, partial [Alphaproteobacteria bacterium]|nr:hypothetical protein [Alphaproteobacteria bacterium]